LFISRGCPENKIFIIMNSPMERIFRLREEMPAQSSYARGDRFTLMYHGGIFERSGIDVGLKAISLLRRDIPNLEFRVFGSGDYIETFRELVQKYGLQDIVKYFGSVPLETIAQEICSIHVGIIPNKKNPFTDLNFPVRIFEYLSLHKPVVVPKTQGILDYFTNDSIFLFEAGNAESLAEAILRIYRNSLYTKQVMERSLKVYECYRWERQRRQLVKLVNGLVKRKAGLKLPTTDQKMNNRLL
ncbi:MAG: glycosyltransferase family 4 protein, partial [Clostridiales bacterium]|nr:glycosyltransferase family 4 protein [Clostridiales bacterium]